MTAQQDSYIKTNNIYEDSDICLYVITCSYKPNMHNTTNDLVIWSSTHYYTPVVSILCES